MRLKKIEKKFTKAKQKKINKLKKYAGQGNIYEIFEDLTSSQIRELKSKEQYLK